MCLSIANMCSENYEVVKEAEDEDDERKADEKNPDEVPWMTLYNVSFISRPGD